MIIQLFTSKMFEFFLLIKKSFKKPKQDRIKHSSYQIKTARKLRSPGCYLFIVASNPLWISSPHYDKL